MNPTAEQLRAAIAAQEQQIEALRECIAANQNKLRDMEQGWPQIGDMYCSLTSYGTLHESLWGHDFHDHARYLRGNVMRQHEAEAADRVRIAVTAINRAIDAGNKAEGWVADWAELRHFPVYDHEKQKWDVYGWVFWQHLSQIHEGSHSVITNTLKTHAAELDVVRKGGVE